MLKVKTSSGMWDRFCDQILSFLKADIIDMNIEGKNVRGFRSPDSPSLWIRDHSDILRGGKYIESDVKSAVDIFAEMQAQNGRIFDYVMTIPLKNSSEKENWEKWVRVPVEADVEFRFVKAAFLAWQACGDEKWLANILPSLERALTYSISHPLRWDQQTGLIKRPYTIDTWDFDYTARRADWLNFQITDQTFWGIFHGDNSGFYESARLLGKLYHEIDNSENAQKWNQIAIDIRQRTNELLFNGPFYTHFHKITPVTIAGVDEAKQLSLSTPMAINRGLATHEIAVAILQEYQKRSEQTDAFAEWFGIDPPFPDGIFGDEKLIGGAYINGGIFPLVGGELAKAAFDHGMEIYGFQQLEKYRKMIAENNATYLWYFPDGTPCSIETSTSPDAMPTDGWGASAMLYGFIEGLCGIEDLSHSYQNLRISPKWAITDEDEVSVAIGYAASEKIISYVYHNDKETQTIKLHLNAENANLELRVLLPENTNPISLQWNKRDVPFLTEEIESSTYLTSTGKIDAKLEIQINYQNNL